MNDLPTSHFFLIHCLGIITSKMGECAGPGALAKCCLKRKHETLNIEVGRTEPRSFCEYFNSIGMLGFASPGSFFFVSILSFIRVSIKRPLCHVPRLHTRNSQYTYALAYPTTIGTLLSSSSDAPHRNRFKRHFDMCKVALRCMVGKLKARVFGTRSDALAKRNDNQHGY